jgi:hypothetical protein
MMLELLVATACVNGRGCSETTSAYYKSNIELQQTVERAELYGKNLVKNHDWIVWAVTPAATLASGQTARFKLYKTTTFGINAKNQLLLFEFNY